MTSSNTAAQLLIQRLHHCKISQGATPLVMGILNVTPDSFSDGGRFFDSENALAQVRQMIAEGVDIIDVGGESTRPGAAEVACEDEINRVVPVIKAIRAEFDIPVSVDTSKGEVMKAAITAGATLINDVTALESPYALEVAADSDLPVCIMHMLGSPRTMQTNPQYESLVEDIIRYLQMRVEACVRAGINEKRIVIDPGFGFGKSLAHNYELLRHLERFNVLGLPVLVGMSRKTMIGNLLDIPPQERGNASAILSALAAERGAAVIRVHDVRQTVEAVKLVHAMSWLK